MARLKKVLAALTVPVVAALSLSTGPSAVAGGDRPPVRVHTCHGFKPTIKGTAGRDVLVGTRHRDVVWAGHGWDLIVSRGGNDLICGGRGNDVAAGGPGLDTIRAGRGNDICFGVRREHMHRHFGCEFHDYGKPPRIQPPHQEPRSAPTAEQVATPVGGQQRRAPDFSFTWDTPQCSLGTINYGNVYFTAEFQNPGWVAIREVTAYEVIGGQFSDYRFGDWSLWNAPNDDAYYSVNYGQNAASDSFEVFYQILWWDGSQWTHGSTYQAKPIHFSEYDINFDYCFAS